MRKKLFLSIFLFALTIGLSGCYVPFVKKEITIPFFEKKPEKAISLMIDKMSNLKTVKYKTNIAVKMHVDPSKMENNPLSFLNNSAEPKVLGKSISAFDKNIMNDKNISPADLNMPSMLDSTPVDFKYNIFLSSASDNTDKNNLKNETKFNLNFDIGGTSMSLKAETKIINKKIYFKINQLPVFITAMFGQFTDKWYELDMEELQKFQEEQLQKEDLKTNLKNFDFNENNKKIKEFETKINKLIKKTKLISVKKRLKDEKIDNKKCYHYQTSINKNNLDKFIKGFEKILKQEFAKEKNNEDFNKIIEDPELDSFINNLTKIIKKSEIELWIDKKDFYLQKATFDFQLDFSNIEIDKQKIPQDALNIEISGDVAYSNFNQPLNIKAPKDSKSLIEEIKSETGKIGQGMFVQSKKPTNNFIDTDNDGLSDEEEKALGTNPYLADSDNDGLSDKEEVNIYNTNPTNPDSDSDGYLDGEEIKNGYNPNGQGKLEIKTIPQKHSLNANN